MTDSQKVSGVFHIEGESIPAVLDVSQQQVTIAVEPELSAALRATATPRPAKFSWEVDEYMEGEATYLSSEDHVDVYQLTLPSRSVDM